ncbi:hypothetical protein EW026_g4106 [Hermanssonia centrifuga]|uniref:DUF6533 domain-containing protein n=1 Tax=Hermanssonia centrifuga TaxID=98765 RepID=A0A4V3XAG2_9APHY|nr:hypothetical protein EW026_g4106 [Hermanssonia centrifuga]
MSQTDSEIAAEFHTDFVLALVVYATSALVVYEYIITIHQEVTMVWLRKWSITTWMFMVNRYLMISLMVWGVAPASAKYDTTQETALFFQDPVLGTFCGWTSDLSANVNFEYVNRISMIRTAILLLIRHRTVALGSRLAIIIADIIVLALTWCKTFRNWRDSIQLGIKSPWSSILLRDGTIYFVALLAMNVAQVMVKTVPSLQDYSPSDSVIEVLNPILICRFLLNLRQLDIAGSEDTTHEPSNSRFSVPGFRVPTLASIIGNMGEDLNYVDMEDVDGGMHGTIDEADGDAPAENTTATPQESTSTYHGNLSTNENPEIQETLHDDVV